MSIQLIYASTAKPHLQFEDIQAILTEANQFNQSQNISGVLLYDGIYFLQVLEGDNASIEQLYEKIAKDPRHNDIHIIGTKEIVNRDFEAWNMGYVNDTQRIKTLLESYTQRSLFLPHRLSFETAKEILLALSKII